MRTTTIRTAVAVFALLAPAGLAAQVANPLPRAFGMGGNYTSIARGYSATAWNPAGLGMPDNPRFSFSLAPFNVAAGLGPITLSDMAEYDGELIPYDARVEWLDEIQEAGAEQGTADADFTYLALSIGPVAVSASSSVRSRIDMGPDVAELVFFGNAGLTGAPQAYDFGVSNFDIAGTTTFAASVGVPLPVSLGPLPDQHLSVGATLKYTIGNFLILGQEENSRLQSDPLAVDVMFPMVHTPLPDSSESFGYDDHLSNGSGIGLDVGAAWRGGPFSAGLVIRNLVNTFDWDLESLEYREGTINWDADTVYSSFEEAPIDRAPARMIERIGDIYVFSPVVAAGAAFEASRVLTVTGEVRHALEDDLSVGAQNHLGVGAELRAIPFVPLRAGVAAISGGYQLSGGLGITFAGIELSGAAAYRDGEYGDDMLAAFGLVIGID